MSEYESQIDRKGDRWVDAVAAVALITVFLCAAAYWIMSQSA